MKLSVSADTKDQPHGQLNQLVHDQKENRGQGGKPQHQPRGDKGFLPGRPGNPGGFLTDFPNELRGIELGQCRFP